MGRTWRGGFALHAVLIVGACGRASVPTAPRTAVQAPPPAAPPPQLPRAVHFELPSEPMSDPVGPIQPRCPDVGALVKASAVVKQEPASRRRPHPAPGVLDVELSLFIPSNPGQVTFAADRLTVAGGVLVEETFEDADPSRDVLLIRPMGTVARDSTLMVLFGVVCKGATGSLRVNMRFATPWRDGEKVTVESVVGS